MSRLLAGKVCVVTGASSGFGEGLAWRLAGHGASVVVAARREERLHALVTRIRKRGGRAEAVPCDVTSKADLQRLVAETAKAFGRCDVLVNNAGIPEGGSFVDRPLEDLERIVETNFVSALRATKLFLPMLLEARGHLVNVASLAGRFAVPQAPTYSSTKHALVGLSESLGYGLHDHGVAVTVVNPGLTVTEGFPMTEALAHPIYRYLVMQPERVTSELARVIIDRVEGEVSIPSWLALFQMGRILTPALYRAVLRRITTRGA